MICINMNKLILSFNENFKNNSDDIGDFSKTFNFLSKEISNLEFDNCFVDVSRKKRLIDINLYLKNEYFVSIAKEIDETGEDVMFSIAKNHKTLVIDIMPLKELINKLILL